MANDRLREMVQVPSRATVQLGKRRKVNREIKKIKGHKTIVSHLFSNVEWGGFFVSGGSFMKANLLSRFLNIFFDKLITFFIIYS
jgi:hypothetical protein